MFLPPLIRLAATPGWLRVLRVLELGGLAFFVRWAIGGPGYHAAVALATTWEHAHHRRQQSPWEVSAGIVRHYVFFLVGVGGVWNAIGHSVLADQVATSIGWATGSPFQLELAAAHLAWGLAALATPWLHWHATAVLAVTKSVFLLGAAAVHLRDIAVSGNRAPGNAGFSVLWLGDVIVPLVILILVVLATRRESIA
jgi:hypothetical protein